MYQPGVRYLILQDGTKQNPLHTVQSLVSKPGTEYLRIYWPGRGFTLLGLSVDTCVSTVTLLLSTPAGWSVGASILKYASAQIHYMAASNRTSS